jgi:hypothetical protein
MKIIINILILVITICSITQAQTVGERGISTDPRNPQNPDINSPAGGGNAATTPSVENKFYWFNTGNSGNFNHKFSILLIQMAIVLIQPIV